MMGTGRIDCIAMKDAIQRKLARRWARKTDTQIREAVRRDLAVSSAPIARMWRAARARSASIEAAGDTARHPLARAGS